MARYQMKTLADGTTYRVPRHDYPSSLEPKFSTKLLTRLVLLAACIYFVFPIYWLIISATKSDVGIVNTNGLWFAPDEVERGGRIINTGGFHFIENFTGLLAYTADKGHYLRWVANSVFYSVSAGALGTLISVMAGFALTKYRFKGRGAILAGIMSGLLLPVALLSIPLYLMFSTIGLLDNPLAVILPCAVSPFGVFLARVYVEASVPDELLEAARIDGAGEFRTFFTMVLRLLAPAMVTIFLFIFVATWNNFLLPLIMFTNPSLKPVTVGLYGMLSYFDPNKGEVLVGAMLGVLPVIVLFIFLQRFWQSGLAAGAVKG